MRDLEESRRSERSFRSSRVRQFSLTSFREAQRMVVRACGRLILGHGADEPLWAQHLERTSATNVALDLSCVHDVDARGLGLLASLVRRARERGSVVSVTAASRVVQRLGKMVRLNQVLPGPWHEARTVSGSKVAAHQKVASTRMGWLGVRDDSATGCSPLREIGASGGYLLEHARPCRGRRM